MSSDAFAGGAIALLRALADDKKARNGLRWLMAAAYKAGYEPRVGNISLYKLRPSTTSSTCSKKGGWRGVAQQQQPSCERSTNMALV